MLFTILTATGAFLQSLAISSNIASKSSILILSSHIRTYRVPQDFKLPEKKCIKVVDNTKAIQLTISVLKD